MRERDSNANENPPNEFLSRRCLNLHVIRTKREIQVSSYIAWLSLDRNISLCLEARLRRQVCKPSRVSDAAAINLTSLVHYKNSRHPGVDTLRYICMTCSGPPPPISSLLSWAPCPDSHTEFIRPLIKHPPPSLSPPPPPHQPPKPPAAATVPETWLIARTISRRDPLSSWRGPAKKLESFFFAHLAVHRNCRLRPNTVPWGEEGGGGIYLVRDKRRLRTCSLRFILFNGTHTHTPCHTQPHTHTHTHTERRWLQNSWI